MQFELGAVIKGKVKGIADYGAFLELSDGKKGMIHISEISSDFVKNVKDYLTEGQVVKAKVISITENGNLGLSIKKLNSEQKVAPKTDFNKANKLNPEKFGRKMDKKAPQETSFEDMISKFKVTSEEKMAALKRYNESKRGSYSRRGSRRAN